MPYKLMQTLRSSQTSGTCADDKDIDSTRHQLATVFSGTGGVEAYISGSMIPTNRFWILSVMDCNIYKSLNVKCGRSPGKRKVIAALVLKIVVWTGG